MIVDAEGRDLPTPAYRVHVNGEELPRATVRDVISVDVHQVTEGPGSFSITLVNVDPATLAVTWSDDEMFSLGNEVRIEMGYGSESELVILGEVVGIEPEFLPDETPKVTVRGYDRLHRLMRGRRARAFTQVKESDIARELASEAGLSAEVTDSELTLEHVLQVQHTDYEFLAERALRTGYELFVRGDTLYFRPPATGASSELTLALGSDLLEFYPRLSAAGLVGGAGVRGWNAKEKASIHGAARTGDEVAGMGDESGASAADDVFGERTDTTATPVVVSQGEADRTARARFDRMALSYVTAEGVCLGRPDIKAGECVEVAGVGTRFGGRYYVTSVRHTYTPRSGYRTRVWMRRNAT